MKCPKCAYLGFETGDRCRNCGYDFALLVAAAPEADYDLRLSLDDGPAVRAADDDSDPDPWIRQPGGGVSQTGVSQFADEPVIQIDRHFEEDPIIGQAPPRAPADAIARPQRAAAPEPALPLFRPAHHDDDDEPLIKVPAVPRAPLQVRRTPDTPRLREVPRPAPPAPSPVLEFAEAATEKPVVVDAKVPPVDSVSALAAFGNVTNPGARLLAASVDHAILLGIDIVVVYFTVRMAGLSMGEWRLLPLAPMLTFLTLLKLSYFYAFTAMGGQTIGKMAAGTCVVADDGHAVDAAQAMRRTCAGILSVGLLGLGFAPALFGDRRALHDRLAHTRVVSLRSV